MLVSVFLIAFVGCMFAKLCAEPSSERQDLEQVNKEALLVSKKIRDVTDGLKGKRLDEAEDRKRIEDTIQTSKQMPIYYV